MPQMKDHDRPCPMDVSMPLSAYVLTPLIKLLNPSPLPFQGKC